MSAEETKLKIKRKETPLTQAELAKIARITVEELF